MSVSLLRVASARPSATSVSERLIYHLSLDRAFSSVCPDILARERFLSILIDLTDVKGDICRRQELIRAFQSSPDLLDSLCGLASRMNELAHAHREAGREEHRLCMDGHESVQAIKNILQMRAINLRRALLFVKGMKELLMPYATQAEALKELYEMCHALTTEDSCAELLSYCTKYERFQLSGHTDLRLTWDEDGYIRRCEVIDHRFIHVSDPELKKRGLALLRRGEETVYPCARVYPNANSFYGDLIGVGLKELSQTFSVMTDQILQRFEALQSELEFYTVALRYLAKLTERGIPYCFPTLGGEGIRANGLYDLLLALTADDPSRVISNDVDTTVCKGGLIVYGEGGSGKTVYLRAIGAMQVLAQAGLPIPCREAEIAPCRQIATQFSEAEKEFCAGNEAGRFEQEVRELAVMVDSLQQGALVLLNETFQSTAYAEGAEGLYHLLQYFSDCGIRWILVSHLHQLCDLLGPEDAAVMRTEAGYRIVCE